MLEGVRRHILDEEDDAPVIAPVGAGGMADRVVEEDRLARRHRQRNCSVLVDGRVDLLLAGEQAVAPEVLAVRQQRPPVRAGDHAEAPGVGAAIGSASAAITTIGLMSQ